MSIAAALLEVLRRPVPKWLTWTGIVSAFCVAAYTGFLLGVVSAYPLWNNAILPVLFVVSALSAGLAATSLVGLITDRERFEQMWLIKKSHVILLAIEMVVLATMLIIVSSAVPRAPHRLPRSCWASTRQCSGAVWCCLACGAVCHRGLSRCLSRERWETSTTSMVVSVIGEGRCPCGWFHAASAGHSGGSTGAVPVARWRRCRCCARSAMAALAG